VFTWNTKTELPNQSWIRQAIEAKFPQKEDTHPETAMVASSSTALFKKIVKERGLIDDFQSLQSPIIQSWTEGPKEGIELTSKVLGQWSKNQVGKEPLGRSYVNPRIHTEQVPVQYSPWQHQPHTKKSSTNRHQFNHLRVFGSKFLSKYLMKQDQARRQSTRVPSYLVSRVNPYTL